MNSFGDRLRHARAVAGQTQQELAARTGIGQTGIAKIEGGKQEPSLSQLLAMAGALDTSAAALVGEVELPSVTIEATTTYSILCPEHGLIGATRNAADADERRRQHVLVHLGRIL